MVTGADCRLAETHMLGGASKAGVTREDLSQPVVRTDNLNPHVVAVKAAKDRT